MGPITLQEQIDGINKKLDIILQEIELQRRHRLEMEELKEDLMRVGNDVFQSAVNELEEVHDHIKTGDLLFLGKRLLRNINNINRMLETLEGLQDLMQDLHPISKEVFRDILSKLNEFDRKGYFEFLKELGRVFDNIVTSFTAEDVRNLGENIVTILNTVKNLTQPDTLQTLNNALAVYKKLDIEITDDVSYWKLFREINTPEMKRGLAFTIQFLKNLSEKEFNNSLAFQPGAQMN